MSKPLPILQTERRGPLQLDDAVYDRGLACVHCGLCLPACPTYTETGNEADSPRGRIQLMLGMADGRIRASAEAVRHLDLCLDCRACETACPSGVVYHEMIEQTRERLAPGSPPLRHLPPRTAEQRLLRWLFFNVFVHPSRLKMALLPARLMQRAGVYSLLRRCGLLKILPPGLAKMEQMLPENGALWPAALAERFAAVGPRKITVGFVPGCVGSVMFAEVNRKAVELLTAFGAEVVVPRAVECCGAIHHHAGAHEPARQRARRNIDALLPVRGPGVDLIVTTIAGCGAMLREYGALMESDASYSQRAAGFGSRVRDISEVLLELGMPEMKFAVDRTVTYHDACHLAHAQKVTTAPRLLLARVPGLKLVPLAESDMCCGAAGTYNLTEPEMATRLADRKLGHIAATGAEFCVTGNVGCAMHIQSRAAANGKALRVVHPVELIHEAVFGKAIRTARR